MADIIVRDISEICTALPFEAARRIRALASALAAFAAADDKAEAAGRIALELEPLGVRGISCQSLYRKLKELRDAGGNVRAILDGRVLRRLDAERGVSANKELIGHWHQLCADNRRKSAPAFRALLTELRGGVSIPGCGTWRQLWATEHGGVQPPEEMPCPYSMESLPAGWSRLMRMKPDAYALTACRTGTMAAALSALPQVIRTRVGLAPCQVVQVDDAWHEVKVEWAGNRHAQRVAEIVMVDVLTGHIVGWLAKPIRERDDGTREVLRQEWMAYFIAHLLCDIGIPSAGCLVMGEHGTATLDSQMQSAIAEVTGGLVRFGAGGLLSKPLAAGLYGGTARGNPRYKGIVEGLHALLKNELGAVKGHIGGGRGAEPEDAAAMERADQELRAIARAAEESHPGITARLRFPYLNYYDYLTLAELAYERIDTRTDHHMEGWERCGFITGQWRPARNQAWLPLQALDAMDAKAAAAFRSLIESDDALYRTRQLSPREAFASRAGELHRYDAAAAVTLMGERLARACVCSDKLELVYKDESTLRECRVVGVLDGGELLERGASYQVWVNPLNPMVAYVADKDGRFLGTAQVNTPARYDDQEGIGRQLGVRQRAISAERKKMAPILIGKIARANADAQHNAMVLTGVDPVAVEEARKIVRDVRPVEIEDMIPETRDAGTDVTIEDLI